MTITGTSTHHDVVVAWARHDIEHVTGPNPWRERAERVLREWHSYEVMTGAEIADVLGAYYPEEPPMVPGLDFLPEQVEADAALIVAELDAEDLRIKPKARPTDVTVADKQHLVQPGTHAEQMIVYRGEHSGWVGICVCGHQTNYFADRVSALLHLSSHIVKMAELVEVTDEPTAVDRG